MPLSTPIRSIEGIIIEFIQRVEMQSVEPVVDFEGKRIAKINPVFYYCKIHKS